MVEQAANTGYAIKRMGGTLYMGTASVWVEQAANTGYAIKRMGGTLYMVRQAYGRASG